MNTLSKIIGTVAVVLLMASTGFAQQKASWVAPKDADALKNPLKGNVASVAEGKKLYTQYCTVCHGDKGKGDGPAGISLTPRPADHSSIRVQSESDGAIFWKITNGRPPMASYKGALTDEQRWQLVNYIRELGKKPAKKGKTN